MGMNLSLKVRHPKCVNNYVYMLLPQKSAAKVQQNPLSRKFILQKITSTPKFNTDKKESVSESWHTLRYEGLIGAIISYLVFALNDYFLSQLSPRTIISPSRQIPLDHRHYPRSRRGVAPKVVRRMGSYAKPYPIAMDGCSSLHHKDKACIPHTSDRLAIPIVE